MLNRDELKEIISSLVPEAEFPEGTQLPEVIVPVAKLVELAEKIKTNPKTKKDHVCFHTSVKEALANVTEWGLTDIFRAHRPDSIH